MRVLFLAFALMFGACYAFPGAVSAGVIADIFDDNSEEYQDDSSGYRVDMSRDFDDDVLDFCGSFDSNKGPDSIKDFFDKHDDVLHDIYNYVASDKGYTYEEFLEMFGDAWFKDSTFHYMFCGDLNMNFQHNAHDAYVSLVGAHYGRRIEQLLDDRILDISINCGSMRERDGVVTVGLRFIEDIEGSANDALGYKGACVTRRYVDNWGAEKLLAEMSKGYFDFRESVSKGGMAAKDSRMAGKFACVHEVEVGGVPIGFRVIMNNGLFSAGYPVHGKKTLGDICRKLKKSDDEYSYYNNCLPCKVSTVISGGASAEPTFG